MKGGSQAVIVPHKHAGVFISKSKEDALCTKNMVPGESVYGEKRVSVQVRASSCSVMQLLMFTTSIGTFCFSPNTLGLGYQLIVGRNR
jgi:hypothetical protein